MSHDDTKDLKFNQLYAGRSRSRRDLNTLKTQVVEAYAGENTGITRYQTNPYLGGVHTASQMIDFSPTGFQGGYIPCGPNAYTKLWSHADLDHAEVTVPIFRGVGDFSGRTVRGSSRLDLSVDNCSYNILGAQIVSFATNPLTGAASSIADTSNDFTECWLSLGVANYTAFALIDGQNGYDVHGISNTSVAPQVASAGSASTVGIFPGWSHNTATVGGGSTNGIITGTDAPVSVGGGANAWNGVTLNIKVAGGSAKVNQIDRGLIMITLWYSIDPL